MLEVIAPIMGTVMSAAYFPQAWKIYQKKNAENISLFSNGIFMVGTNIWLAYGIQTQSWTIISGFFLGAIGSTLVFFLTAYYQKIRRTKD